jgi:hypothetical protein
MALSKIKTIAFLLLLMAAAGKNHAANNPLNFHAISGIDSLNLPPLNKFIGKEVDMLLGQLDPQNYEKSYIVTPQGILNGIIVRFEISGIALHIYLANPTQYNVQSSTKAGLVNRDKINRIEVYSEDKFVTCVCVEKFSADNSCQYLDHASC